MNRIYGVMNRRLSDREFLAGRYSIADIACIGWVWRAERHGHDLSDFANVFRWRETVLARPAVQRGLKVKVVEAFHVDIQDPKVRRFCSTRRPAEGMHTLEGRNRRDIPPPFRGRSASKASRVGVEHDRRA